jgi:hypothetical protein
MAELAKQSKIQFVVAQTWVFPVKGLKPRLSILCQGNEARQVGDLARFFARKGGGNDCPHREERLEAGSKRFALKLWI